jgi:myosin-5
MKNCEIVSTDASITTLQTKVIDTTLSVLHDDPSTSSLPPLMNPAMLEASDDLTSLSHLNEPAGMHPFPYLFAEMWY